MAKINQEEYEVLKELDNKWKWIARAESRAVKTFLSKPHKRLHWIFDNSGSWDIKGNENFGIYTNYADLFQFIQWEDEDPHNIAELIEEYAFENVLSDKEQFEEWYHGTEREEAEVKNMKWFKKKLDDIEVNTSSLQNHDAIWMLNRVHELYDQLDEPEILSQEWIDEHAVRKIDGKENPLIVYVDDLQNLLVPKQELPVIPQFIADYLPLVKEDVELERASYYAVTNNELPKWKKEYDWIRENFETFIRAWLAYPNIEVEEEQKYYVINNDQRMMLVRMMDGKTITEADPFKLEDMYEGEKKSHRLTEQEIKDYDERYWPFAKKVEGLEEC